MELDLKLGQTIEVDTGSAVHRGILRYIGPLAVKGQENLEFVGLELPTQTGKNDGAVQNERYFQCAPLHGIFARRDRVTLIIAQPASKAPTRPATSKAAPPKPTTSGPKPRPSRLSTVAGPKSTTASRLSTAGKVPPQRPAQSQPPRPPSTASKAPAASSAQPKRLSIASSSQPSTALRTARKPSISSATSSVTRANAPSTTGSATTSSATTTSTARAPVERTRQISEVEFRRLQKQQEHTSKLEEEAQDLRTENDNIKNILNKLQAKCKQYHTDISGLKDDVAQLKSENEEQAKALQERDSMVELATIDREMAEEQKEQLEAELEDERAKNEELRLELEINQEEASFITDDMPEDQKQAAMLRKAQGERDRYREGIVRLRDLTKEQIKDLEARNRELEAQATRSETVGIDLITANAKVAQLEAYIADLQEQVDASNEWEEMNEDLIEKNHNLEESVSHLYLERRELSTIIEVSNETINDYAEHADELQAELGTRDSQLAEVTRERDGIQAENAKLEDFLLKHKEVAIELQSRLHDLEADKAMTEEEVKDVTGRFNEVMELHRRLRTASVNDTIRRMDSSLQHLAVQEAHEELDMIKYYLTESSYAEFHSASIQAYFRAKSISFKASLTASLVRTTTIDQFGIEQTPEQMLDVVLRHDAVGHLDYISAYAEQTWTAMASCSLEEFVTAGHLFQELESVLRTVEGCMGAVKQDALNLKETSEAARGSYKVMGNIYRVNRYLSDTRPDGAIILHISVLRASLERIRSVFDAVDTFTSRIELIDEDVDGSSDFSYFMEPGMAATEALGIVKKLSNALTALQKDGLYPNLPNGVEGLAEYSDSLDSFANKAQEVAVRFIRRMLDTLAKEPERVDARFMFAQIKTSFVEELPDEFYESLREAKTRIGQWHDHASVLMNCVEVQLPPTPWVVKAQEIEAAKKQSIDAEKKLQLMTTELQSALLQKRECEETIDTKELEIEHLRARNQEAAVKAGTIDALQQALNQAQADREVLQRDIATREAEIGRLSDQLKYPTNDESIALVPATPQLRVERPNDSQIDSVASSPFITFVEALTDENQWLRERENSEMFRTNLQAVSAEMRNGQAEHMRSDSRTKQAWAAEMLQMTADAQLLGVPRSSTRTPETPQRRILDDSDFWSDAWTPDAKSTPLPTPVRAARQMTPLRIETSPSLLHLEDLSFIDLSPVADEFSFEMAEVFEN